MDTSAFTVRRGAEADSGSWVALYQAVAAEGKWIGGEAPVDVEEVRRRYVERHFGTEEPAAVFLAEADAGVIGQIDLRLQHGIADLGMVVSAGWRGRGVGTALMRAGVDWAGAAGAHKMALQVWPHNASARRLYQRFGFVEEGRLRRHWRRRDGALWDSIVMGLVLDTTAPGSPLADEPAGQAVAATRP